MIDLYCERTGPGLWAEPVNALTNLAFFAAAWALWHSARSTRTVGPGARLLIGLLVAIGTWKHALPHVRDTVVADS